MDPIFVHVCKTGGMSIVKSLGLQKGWRPGHYQASVTRTHLGEDRWSKGFKFSFVRNPYSRMVSYFHFAKQTGLLNGKVTVFRPVSFQHLSFLEFLRKAFVDRDDRYWLPRNVLNSQSWLLDVPLDYTGRFETLSEDFQVICGHLEVKAVLGHRNFSQHEHYASYYNQEAEAIIRKEFAEDFERFGYSTHVTNPSVTKGKPCFLTN